MEKDKVKEMLKKEITEITGQNITDDKANLFSDSFSIEIVDLLVVFSNIGEKTGINIFDIFKFINVDDFTVNGISELIAASI